MYFYGVICRYIIVIVFCIVCIVSQLSGWIGNDDSIYNVSELIPLNDGYIINIICAYHRRNYPQIDAIGGITWSNGTNLFEDNQYYGDTEAGITSTFSCFDTSCIRNIEYKVATWAITELTVESGLKSQRWGYDGERNSGVFFCKPNNCISKLKVKADSMIRGISVECAGETSVG